MLVSSAPGRAARPLRSGPAAGLAQATMGFAELPATAADGPVTLYYPAAAAEQPVARGRLTIQMAPQAPPVPGNGRLVVISPGSGGAPWVHADLARRLVAAGFVVALPEHRGDNWLDPGRPGPDSWVQRPAEVARVIDAVGRDGRFGPAPDLARVGVYGMSAGGHTALSLAVERPTGLRPWPTARGGRQDCCAFQPASVEVSAAGKDLSACAPPARRPAPSQAP